MNADADTGREYEPSSWGWVADQVAEYVPALTELFISFGIVAGDRDVGDPTHVSAVQDEPGHRQEGAPAKRPLAAVRFRQAEQHGRHDGAHQHLDPEQHQLPGNASGAEPGQSAHSRALMVG